MVGWFQKCFPWPVLDGFIEILFLVALEKGGCSFGGNLTLQVTSFAVYLLSTVDWATSWFSRSLEKGISHIIP